MGLNLSKYQKGYFTSLYSLTDFLVHDWIRTNMKRFFYLNFLTQSGVIIFSQHLQVAEMCTLRICLCKIDSFSSNLNSVSSQLDIVWTIIYLFLAAQSVIEESVRIMGHTVFYVALDWVLKIFFPLCASVIGKWRKTQWVIAWKLVEWWLMTYSVLPTYYIVHAQSIEWKNLLLDLIFVSFHTPSE